MKSKWNKGLLTILSIIYFAFIYMDIFTHISPQYISIVKYTSIILCFILSIVLNNKDHAIDSRLLQTGIFFTLVADLVLLILEDYVMGVLLFTVVQLVYIARYSKTKYIQVIHKLFIILLIIFSMYFLISILIVKTSFILIPVGLFYIVCLITSVLKGINISKDNSYLNPNKRYICLGMVLFLLCDTSIGIAYLLRTYDYFHLANISSTLIWVFYLPSQVLLAKSSYGISK